MDKNLSYLNILGRIPFSTQSGDINLDIGCAFKNFNGPNTSLDPLLPLLLTFAATNDTARDKLQTLRYIVIITIFLFFLI